MMIIIFVIIIIITSAIIPQSYDRRQIIIIFSLIINVYLSQWTREKIILTLKCLHTQQSTLKIEKHFHTHKMYGEVKLCGKKNTISMMKN